MSGNAARHHPDSVLVCRLPSTRASSPGARGFRAGIISNRHKGKQPRSSMGAPGCPVSFTGKSPGSPRKVVSWHMNQHVDQYASQERRRLQSRHAQPPLEAVGASSLRWQFSFNSVGPTQLGLAYNPPDPHRGSTQMLANQSMLTTRTNTHFLSTRQRQKSYRPVDEGWHDKPP